MNNNFPLFKKHINNRLFFKKFLLSKLPSAFFAGLKAEHVDEEKAVVSVQQKWFNKNPFRSIYFAVLTMAGEMSTGILCLGNIYKRTPGVSMLVTEQRGVFHKKATGKILFTCEDGNKIMNAVDAAISTGNSIAIICYAKGTNYNNELVAEFWVTWSFKLRKSKAISVEG
ncbi:MAG: thioesterase [Parafilimonas sp.]